jgi:ribonuclease HII
VTDRSTPTAPAPVPAASAPTARAAADKAPTARKPAKKKASKRAPRPGQATTLRKALKGKAPGLGFERELWEAGHDVVVGVDEVGRGAWAGPIMVGAAVVPKDKRLTKVRDSKMLTEREREVMFDRIAAWCVAWAVGAASQEECDELGMSAAQKLAARRAIDGLGVVPDHVLIDGNWNFVGGSNVRKIIRGDSSSLSIAAASILAKVTRDRYMRGEAVHYPGYEFESNKGYPCPRHKAYLAGMGPSAIHRRAWVFMDHLPWSGCERVTPPGLQLSLFDQPPAAEVGPEPT